MSAADGGADGAGGRARGARPEVTAYWRAAGRAYAAAAAAGYVPGQFAAAAVRSSAPCRAFWWHATLRALPAGALPGGRAAVRAAVHAAEVVDIARGDVLEFAATAIRHARWGAP